MTLAAYRGLASHVHLDDWQILLLGLTCGIGGAGAFVAARCSRVRVRHAELAERLRAVPRPVRRGIRDAIRSGGSVPIQQAPLLLLFAETSLKIRRAQRLRPAQRRDHAAAFLPAPLFAVFVFTSVGFTRDLGLFAFGVYLPLAAFTLAALLRQRHFDRYWTPRLTAARREARRLIDADSPLAECERRSSRPGASSA